MDEGNIALTVQRCERRIAELLDQVARLTAENALISDGLKRAHDAVIEARRKNMKTGVDND